MFDALQLSDLQVEIPYEDVIGRAFLHRESRLVHVEENGQFVESPPPAGAGGVVELSVLLTVCDLRSASSSAEETVGVGQREDDDDCGDGSGVGGERKAYKRNTASFTRRHACMDCSR